jgi:hypothetical protein
MATKRKHCPPDLDVLHSFASDLVRLFGAETPLSDSEESPRNWEQATGLSSSICVFYDASVLRQLTHWIILFDRI